MCTTTRAKKVVVGLTLVALVVQAVHFVGGHLYGNTAICNTHTIMLHTVLPVIVLIINAIVVREVRRRASSDAASNLGLQHHQSTSAVPTVMLVATSLIYVLLNGTTTILVLVYVYTTSISEDSRSLIEPYLTVNDLLRVVYAYNFYVYVITGKQFRSELYRLFCCCRSSSSSSSFSPSSVAVVAVVHDTAPVIRHDEADTVV